MAHLVHYRTSFFMKTHIILYQILLFSCTFGKLFVSLHHKNLYIFFTLNNIPNISEIVYIEDIKTIFLG